MGTPTTYLDREWEHLPPRWTQYYNKFFFEFPEMSLPELLERFPLQEPEMAVNYSASDVIQFRFLHNVSLYDLDGRPYSTRFIGGSMGTPDVRPDGVVYAGEGVHLTLLTDDLFFKNEQTEILAEITFASGFDYPASVDMVIPIEYFGKTPANGP